MHLGLLQLLLLVDHVQAVIYGIDLLAVVAELLRLDLACDVVLHLPFEVLDDGLCLADVATPSDRRALLHGVVAE